MSPQTSNHIMTTCAVLVMVVGEVLAYSSHLFSVVHKLMAMVDNNSKLVTALSTCKLNISVVASNWAESRIMMLLLDETM